MATTKKTIKRQPAKRKLPSSSVKAKTSAAKVSKIKVVKSASTAKRIYKKRTPSKVSRTKSARKPAVRPKTKTIELSLLFGKKSKLTFIIKLSSPDRKKSTTTKKSLQVVPEKQALISLMFICLGFIGAIYFGLQIFAGPKLQASTPAQQETVAVKPVKKSLPESDATRLIIPSIGVDTPVGEVGKLADGSLATPKEYDKVAQYKFGPTAGEIGPAIIVGHLDSYKGPAVFWRLHEIKPGQIIKVKRADGKVAKFKVNKIQDFEQNKFPTKKVYGNINHAGLRLITCGGTFNYLKQRYSHNTVVFATLI